MINVLWLWCYLL